MELIDPYLTVASGNYLEAQSWGLHSDPILRPISPEGRC